MDRELLAMKHAALLPLVLRWAQSKPKPQSVPARFASVGETMSEGGFAPNRVSAASLLNATSEKDKKGKTFYLLEVREATSAAPL